MNPSYVSFLSGSIAGGVEVLTMYPSDVVKTRSQLRSRSIGFFKDLTRVFREGAAYRGVGTLLTCDPLKRSLKFGMFQEYSTILKREVPELTAGWQRGGFAGAMAGATETLFECPFENVKIRMQIKTLSYGHSLECLGLILKNESFLSLYRGLSAHMLRNTIWNSCYFGTAGLRRMYSQEYGGNLSGPAQAFVNFVCGASGGALGVICNTPFDVVKSRMQDITQKVPYTGIISSLRRIVDQEGLPALYKGLKPRVFRLGLGGGIMMIAFDAIREFLEGEHFNNW